MCLSLCGPFLLGVVVLEPSLTAQRVYNICIWLAANGSALFLGSPESWQCVVWTLPKLLGSRVFCARLDSLQWPWSGVYLWPNWR